MKRTKASRRRAAIKGTYTRKLREQFDRAVLNVWGNGDVDAEMFCNAVHDLAKQMVRNYAPPLERK